MRTNKSIFVVFLFAVPAALIPSIGYGSTSYGTFCGHWGSVFPDSGIGEDTFTSTGYTYRDAQYTLATVYKASTWEVVWSTGTLDENGCTDQIDLVTGVQYRFRMRTIAQIDSANRIFVQRQNATTWTTALDDGYEIWDFLFTPTIPNAYYGFLANSLVEYETNLMPIAGKIWDRQEDGTIEIPDDTVILIRYDNVGPDYGYSYAGTSGGYYRVWSGSAATSAKKFVLAHEIGHAVGHAKAHLHRGEASYGLAQPYAICSCNHISLDCEHCIQSRENIRIGESEGWAHFFSSTVFNNRTSASSYFGYYKDINYPYPFADCTEKPCTINLVSKQKWMEANCNTLPENKGVEWDWLTFFWGLWTEDTNYKYTMTQITDVWEEVHDVDTEADEDDELWHWADLVTAADNLYSGSKFTEFTDQGDNSGVNH